jgi:hypothetical protein
LLCEVVVVRSATLGRGLGMPFVAAEPRVQAAVVGLSGSPAPAGIAGRITVPVQFLVQWDDERVPRATSLATGPRTGEILALPVEVPGAGRP